jgi:hypothetical protein
MRQTLAKVVAVLAAASLAVPAWGQAPAAALTRIGAAAAVHGSVKAQAPNTTVGRVVQSGKPIFLNDHVTTDAAGKLQVLLLDETVFTLGPNADMVLDEYVYDPDTHEGKIAARVTKGVFRFVTGRVAQRDPKKMQVRLPAGTIGIRGTMVIGEAGASESTAILLGPGGQTNTDEASGAIVVENNGVSRFISEPGKGVTIKNGQAPSSITDLSQRAQQLQTALATPPNLRAQNTGAGAAGGSATHQASEDTASGRVSPEAALDETQSQDQQRLLFEQAVQNSIVDGNPATWEAIRSNITTGDGFFFSGHSPISCTGSGCNPSGNPVGALQLYIDFGARKIGGSTAFVGPSGNTGSFIHTHGINQPNQGDTIQQLIGLSGGSGAINFAALSGPATLVLSSANTGSTTGNGGGTGTFDGTVISLVNANGQVAGAAQVQLKFTGTNSSSANINQSGTFLAPR